MYNYNVSQADLWAQIVFITEATYWAFISASVTVLNVQQKSCKDYLEFLNLLGSFLCVSGQK